MGSRFGELARKTRIREEKVSLRALAEALGWTPAYVSDIERGNRSAPSPAKARQWALIIGGDPEKFERVAISDRDAVELRFNGNTEKTKAAVALARSWADLTEEQSQQLNEAIARIVGGEE